MKSSTFEYSRPRTLEEAVALLGDRPDDAKILGGGQSLLPMMAMRFARTDLLIDVSNIAELLDVAEFDDYISYGAAIPHSVFEDELVPDGTRGLIPFAASGIGYRAIRNRGTIGGSIAHADASAEWPTLLAGLDATIVARSPSGERAISARSFVLGFFWNALEPDEILVRIEVPRTRSTWGWQKSVRKAGEFAESLSMVQLNNDTGVANVWLGAARDTPIELKATEVAVAGLMAEGEPLAGRLDSGAQQTVLAAVRDDLGSPATSEDRYRAQLHGIGVWRALNQAATEGNSR